MSVTDVTDCTRFWVLRVFIQLNIIQMFPEKGYIRHIRHTLPLGRRQMGQLGPEGGKIRSVTFRHIRHTFGQLCQVEGE